MWIKKKGQVFDMGVKTKSEMIVFALLNAKSTNNVRKGDVI